MVLGKHFSWLAGRMDAWISFQEEWMDEWMDEWMEIRIENQKHDFNEIIVNKLSLNMEKTEVLN